MTEDEAKTKWCPQTRVTGTADEWHTNRPSHAEVDAANFDRCIGSACMAWRVATIYAHQENAYNQAQAPEGDGWKPTAPGPQNRNWWRTIPERREGHCGLAGAPQ